MGMGYTHVSDDAKTTKILLIHIKRENEIRGVGCHTHKDILSVYSKNQNHQSK